MMTVFIGNTAVILPRTLKAGDEMDEATASLLNSIDLNRIRAKLRYLLSTGAVAIEELQLKANELALQPMAAYSTDDEGEADPVVEEAMNLARDMITTQMAKDGLPPPKGLDTHAKALVEALPALREKARLRVEARFKAAAEAMERLV